MYKYKLYFYEIFYYFIEITLWNIMLYYKISKNFFKNINNVKLSKRNRASKNKQK